MNTEKIYYNEVLIKLDSNEPARKPAFAFFNRDVNKGHVNLIFEKMKVKGYRMSEPIQIMKGEKLISTGIELFDLNGNKIETANYQECGLVVEGQHRTFAVSVYNKWLQSEGKDIINIPAIEVELINDEAITEYLNEINITKKEWTKEDYLIGSANLDRSEPLLQKYKELIKRDSNPSGFPLSTLNLIYCGGSGLNRSDFILLCSGQTKKGKANKNIMPGYDIETGDKFIEICKKLELQDSEISKRYLIQEFNRIRIENDGTNKAFSIFNSINKDDVSAMLNSKGRLVDINVTSQMEIIKERYYTHNSVN